MSRNPEKLTCIAIIICDDIYRDERTKKLVIIGTFHDIKATSFPCVHPRMRVLFTLTNGQGDYSLSLSVEHERSGRKLVELSGPFHVDNKLAIVDVDVELANLRFDEPGKHWVILAADGEIIQQRPFVVHAAGEQRA